MDLDILQQINDIDLAKVETSYPIPMAGVVAATITEIELKKIENKKGESNPWALIKYATSQPWKTQPLENNPSRDLNPGFVITERISLKPWTDPKTDEVKNFGITRLAQMREAIFGKAQPGAKFVVEELLGQTILLKLKFDPAPKNRETGEVYGPQTSVDGYNKAKK
jgi:hypothetical protein